MNGGTFKTVIAGLIIAFVVGTIGGGFTIHGALADLRTEVAALTVEVGNMKDVLDQGHQFSERTGR